MNKTKRLDTRISPKEYRDAVKSAKACDMGLCEYVREAVRRLNSQVELWRDEMIKKKCPEDVGE